MYIERGKRMMYSQSEIHEECGVFGVIAAEPADVAGISYYGLDRKSVV